MTITKKQGKSLEFKTRKEIITLTLRQAWKPNSVTSFKQNLVGKGKKMR